MSNPSFLCVPYRYKASKLYSQVPSSTLGDFNVVRPASNSATRVNAAGFIETVPDNVPRLDYPLGGISAGCPALLVEPTAANYLVRSQEFDNGSWGKSVLGIDTSIGTTGIEANVAISPDGTQNADRVNFLLQTDPDLGLNQNYAAATSGQTYNTSIWFKGEGTNIGKQIKVQMKRTSGGTFVGTTATITLTSGWVRFASSAITLGASNSGVFLCVSSNDATNALIWGAQLEQGSVATSYIPTAASPVTRNEDRITKTGITSLIGQTEGTFYFEGEANFAATDLPSLNRSVTNSVLLAKNASNQVVAYVYYGGVFLPIFATASAITGPFKAALAYKQGSPGNTAFFVNGVQAGSTNASNWAFTGELNDVIVRADPYIAGGKPYRVRALGVYPTRIPNTAPLGVLSLQSLTQ